MLIYLNEYYLATCILFSLTAIVSPKNMSDKQSEVYAKYIKSKFNQELEVTNQETSDDVET